MKHFIDTEFLEGPQNKTMLGIKYGETRPTIDLISIGIVSEDNGEYYAISKDFNLKDAWGRYQLKGANTFDGQLVDAVNKEYWIRENVLKPIYKKLHSKENLHARQAFHRANVYIAETKFDFTYKNLKKLINKYGKTNKQIAKEIKEFVAYTEHPELHPEDYYYKKDSFDFKGVEFYAYYADYDWVAFCWLFGKMMDLPKGFPMYCIDLKQEMDSIALKKGTNWFNGEEENIYGLEHPINKNPSFENKVSLIKRMKGYPKQTNEHNALADAKWNRELYDFLNKL